jgi:hypothetical protein
LAQYNFWGRAVSPNGSFHELKFAGMCSGLARAVYIVTATKDGLTEFWAAATPSDHAAVAVQQVLPPGWRVMFSGWRLNPTKAAALKMSSNSVRKLVDSAAIDRGLFLAR